MLHTTLVLKRLSLDNGVDFPTIFRAYLEVIEGKSPNPKLYTLNPKLIFV